MKKYMNFEFDAQDTHETNQQRYERLLKEFSYKSNARFSMLAEEEGQAKSYKDRVSALMRQVPTNKINKLYNSIEACWKKTVYGGQEELLIQILARLNRACDEPSDLSNLQQLAILTEEIPNKELHWHTAQCILSLFLTVSIALAITIPLLSLTPPLGIIGITFLIATIGSCFASNELWNLGFKSHLKPVQNNINRITFFTPSPSESEEKETAPPSYDDMSGSVARL
jgi:hypothetical protein